MKLSLTNRKNIERTIYMNIKYLFDSGLNIETMADYLETSVKHITDVCMGKSKLDSFRLTIFAVLLDLRCSDFYKPPECFKSLVNIDFIRECNSLDAEELHTIEYKNILNRINKEREK